jgi:hypothetical protein
MSKDNEKSDYLTGRDQGEAARNDHDRQGSFVNEARRWTGTDPYSPESNRTGNDERDPGYSDGYHDKDK